jgi:hypothetical protein
VTSHTSQFYT